MVIKFINKTFRIFVQSGRTDDDDRVVVVIALFSKGLSSSCYIKLLEGNEINEKETGNGPQNGLINAVQCDQIKIAKCL